MKFSQPSFLCVLDLEWINKLTFLKYKACWKKKKKKKKKKYREVQLL